MRAFQVGYFYHATGMDRADTHDYGVVYASDKEGAIQRILKANFRPDSWNFARTCLLTREVSFAIPHPMPPLGQLGHFEMVIYNDEGGAEFQRPRWVPKYD